MVVTIVALESTRRGGFGAVWCWCWHKGEVEVLLGGTDEGVAAYA